ncbi:MAG: hypothetical protein LAP40_19495 [Acidobacteriia bacterium]|nr:hypothetical protein [Terriglobia bacterium]
MPLVANIEGTQVWELPPLILHPFNEHVSPTALLENSRATLMLSGLVANDGTEPEILMRRLLSGRYAETRMLFFLGKDILRWMGQCVEGTKRARELEGSGLEKQSFAELLIAHPPEAVKAKLTQWGVVDHAAIFSRAIGLNTLFARPPEFDLLSEEFLQHYHRYADHLYASFLESEPYGPARAAQFRFEIYASGEYARLLETEWGGT